MKFSKACLLYLTILSGFDAAALAQDMLNTGMDASDQPTVQQVSDDDSNELQTAPTSQPLGEATQLPQNAQGLVPSQGQDLDPQFVPGQPTPRDQQIQEQQIQDQQIRDQQIRDQQIQDQQIQDQQIRDQQNRNQQIRDQQTQGQPPIQGQTQGQGQPPIQGQTQMRGQPPVQGQTQVLGQPPLQQGQGQPPIQGQPQVQGQPQNQAPSTGAGQAPVRGQPVPQKPRVLPTQVPAPIPVPPTPRAEPETYVQPQPSGPKSETQKAYETSMQTRWSAAADAIIALKSQVETLQGKRQKALRESLRTASGNRSIAKTKLNQLMRAPSADFDKLKVGVERAFEDLDAAIQRARSQLTAPEAP